MARFSGRNRVIGGHSSPGRREDGSEESRDRCKRFPGVTRDQAARAARRRRAGDGPRNQLNQGHFRPRRRVPLRRHLRRRALRDAMAGCDVVFYCVSTQGVAARPAPLFRPTSRACATRSTPPSTPSSSGSSSPARSARSRSATTAPPPKTSPSTGTRSAAVTSNPASTQRISCCSTPVNADCPPS